MIFQWTFINERLVRKEDANISITDLALQRAYGVFDFIKVINYQPVFLDEHLERLERSAKEMRLPLPFGKDEFKDIIVELIRRNNFPAGGIKIIVTGGCSEDGFSIARPNVIITQTPLPPSNSKEKKGIKLMTFNYQRNLPTVKSIDYITAIWLQPMLKQQKVDDVLYFQNNIISECPRSNFFLVTNNDVVLTPTNNILNGITRNKVLQLAEENFKVEERDITVEELENCKESFITNTTKEIVPVVQINKIKIANGKPGAITKQLKEQFLELIFLSTK